MNLAVVATDPTVFGYRPAFVVCAALTCLFALSAVALVVLMTVRGRRT